MSSLPPNTLLHKVALRVYTSMSGSRSVLPEAVENVKSGDRLLAVRVSEFAIAVRSFSVALTFAGAVSQPK